MLFHFIKKMYKFINFILKFKITFNIKPIYVKLEFEKIIFSWIGFQSLLLLFIWYIVELNL